LPLTGWINGYRLGGRSDDEKPADSVCACGGDACLAQVINEQQLESTDAGVITALPPSDSPSGSRISRPVIVVSPKPKSTPPDAVTASDAAPKKLDDNSAAQ
jgi:hypothetical protein